MVQSFPWGLLDPFQVLLLQGLLKVQEELVEVQEEFVEVQEELVEVQEELVEVQGELVEVQEEFVKFQVQLKEGNRGWAAVAELGRRAAGRSRIVTLIMAEH